MPEAAEVQRLFARVASRYDLTNDVLSLGVHRAWRRRVVRAARVGVGDRVLDVCCGTGDVALALRATGARVVGVDFCMPMLARAAAKATGTGIRYAAGDALRLPFPDATFDAATVAFGVRNLADPCAGLREMVRVCRPGGRVVVLEFCRPRVPVVATLYGCYFRNVMPRLGAWVSGDRHGAYRYLQRTVEAFPERDAFLAWMRAAGLRDPGYTTVSFGIAAVYAGTVPEGAGAAGGGVPA
ncbi:MAG TPA: ubiquinone/menaquinone biosynthesis methyltransferase [Planctomycetota bacterium]|nr:ubiquinone/menaquinone biosynthesis methyltransferase [Planctomycetota bacterium]